MAIYTDDDRHPTAGAQYRWSYFLAPRYRRFISFFQGMNIILATISPVLTAQDG